MTYQALRRTCATHFQKFGNPRDIQAQLRHSRLEMTGRYVKEIPEQVRKAVESMDKELCEPDIQPSPYSRLRYEGLQRATSHAYSTLTFPPKFVKIRKRFLHSSD